MKIIRSSQFSKDQEKIKLNSRIVSDKYNDLWNQRIAQMQSDLEKDKLEFLKDDHIGFKWTHLLNQEIYMWISLCCGDTVEYSQVPLDDFNFIVKRRGFTPRITKTLRDFLIDIGIGKELK